MQGLKPTAPEIPACRMLQAPMKGTKNSISTKASLNLPKTSAATTYLVILCRAAVPCARVSYLLCSCLLLGGVIVDCAPVLRAPIISLAVQSGRVHFGEKLFQEPLVGCNIRIIVYLHRILWL